MTVHFRRWSDEDTSGRFHNRYLLSEHGGVLSGAGFEEQPSGEDDLSLLAGPVYRLRWSEYVGDPIFKLVDEPASLRGQM